MTDPAVASRGVDRVPPRRNTTIVVAAVGLVVLAFVPWTRSGAVWRNGWATAASARRVGVVEGPAQVVVVLWLLVPVMVGLALLAWATDRPRPAGLAVTAAGAVAAVAGIAVVVGPLPTSVAPMLTVALGGVLAVAAARSCTTRTAVASRPTVAAAPPTAAPSRRAHFSLDEPEDRR